MADSMDDPISAYARKSTAARRVGDDAKCATCGEARSVALIAGRVPMICAECDRKRKGKAVFDRHHVAGRANSPITVQIPVNDHRAELSEAQREWPKLTLENPQRSPLLAAAANVRGFADTVKHLIEKALCWVAEMLECLHDFLHAKLGPGYWRGTPVERFVPKRKTS